MRTIQLALKLRALVDAGLPVALPGLFSLGAVGLPVALPGLFSPGAVTWDTWTWATSVFESRTFASSAMPSWIPGQREARATLRLRPDGQPRRQGAHRVGLRGRRGGRAAPAAVRVRQASHRRFLEGATLVKLGQHHVRIYLSFVSAKDLTKLFSTWSRA